MGATAGPVTDACIFHEWKSTADLAMYLPTGWRDVVLRTRGVGGPTSLKSKPRYRDPFGGRQERGANAAGDAMADGGVGAVIGHLDAAGIGRAVLSYDDGVLATAFPNYHLAPQIAMAANRWTSERWLGADPRLFALGMVSTAQPELAAAEIRRFASDERFVGVLLGANMLGAGYGHPVYRPIFAAAAECGMPVVLAAGADAAVDVGVPATSGGAASTYGEYQALKYHAVASHVANMIVQGLFVEFPGLRVLMAGGGAAWLPGFLWRLDYWYKIDQVEAPWLRFLPSEYFTRHVKVTTAGLEKSPDPSGVATALSTVTGMDQILVYASMFPGPAWQAPGPDVADLPASWRKGVLAGNAAELYRWPDAAAPRQEEMT